MFDNWIFSNLMWLVSRFRALDFGGLVKTWVRVRNEQACRPSRRRAARDRNRLWCRTSNECALNWAVRGGTFLGLYTNMRRLSLRRERERTENGWHTCTRARLRKNVCFRRVLMKDALAYEARDRRLARPARPNAISARLAARKLIDLVWWSICRCKWLRFLPRIAMRILV